MKEATHQKIGNAFLSICLVSYVVCGASLLVNACHPQDSNTQQRVVNTIDLVSYQQALDQCRMKGKDAGSYGVYEACAKEADKKYGRFETPD